MTNEEAIKYLIPPTATSTHPGAEYLKQKEAYELAIGALEFQNNIKKACCSSCGFELENYIREVLKENQKEHNCCYWNKTTNECILGYYEHCPDNYNCDDYD